MGSRKGLWEFLRLTHSRERPLSCRLLIDSILQKGVVHIRLIQSPTDRNGLNSSQQYQVPSANGRSPSQDIPEPLLVIFLFLPVRILPFGPERTEIGRAVRQMEGKSLGVPFHQEMTLSSIADRYLACRMILSGNPSCIEHCRSLAFGG